MHKTVFFTIALYVISMGASIATDWPQFRGLNCDGISTEKGINKNWQQKPPKLLWKTQMSDDGYAGPAAYKGVVYIIDHNTSNDVIRGININTGKDVWSYVYPDADKSNYGFTRSTPAIIEGKIYIASRLGLIGCLDLATGNGLWSWNLINDFAGQKPQWDFAGSPFIDGNKLIIVPGGPSSSIVALDRNSGNIIWKAGTDAPAYSTPVKAKIQGKMQYIVFTANGVGGYDSTAGTPLWFVRWKTQYNVNSAQPIITGNSIFVSSGYGKGCALIDVGQDMSAKIRWESKAIQAHFNSAVLVGGYIYGIGDPGNLVCLDPNTGNIMWSKDGFEKGPVIGIDSVLLALDGASGALVMAACNPSGYRELGRFTPLGGQSWTTPIVTDGKLIIRNKTTLACFNLK